jgi:hypothetical protein
MRSSSWMEQGHVFCDVAIGGACMEGSAMFDGIGWKRSKRDNTIETAGLKGPHLSLLR